MAYLTFVIVTLFFVLNMPRILCAAYEVSNTWRILRCVEGGEKYLPHFLFYTFDQVSFLLMVISSSMNFLIYCTGSEQFKVCIYTTMNTYFTKTIHVRIPLLVIVLNISAVCTSFLTCLPNPF